MKKYRFKFTTKEGVLLGYFLSIGSKLVSQQEAKVFNIHEQVLGHELQYIQDKYMWVFDNNVKGLELLKNEIKSQFNGLKYEDVDFTHEEIKEDEI